MKKIIQVTAIDSSMKVLLGELNRLSVQAGFEVIGVCSEGQNRSGIEADGVKLMNVKIDRKIDVIANIATIFRLRSLFLKEKPEIVHVHTPIAAVLGRVAAKLANIPIVIYTAHGFYFHENMKKNIFAFFVGVEKFMGKFFTDYIFTQSEEDANFAIENKFLSKEKILAIGNGVDIKDKFNPEKVDKRNASDLKKSLGINEDEIIVSFIGRLVEEKGILDLLKAFNLLGNRKIKLIVIGGVFEGDNGLVNIEQEYKSENIIFLGKRTDINNLLNISDIFCLPSYREGMPRSIIEAMAMNNAVIATNIRGAREEVIDTETGFLVNLNSPEEIKEKIEILAGDKVLLNSMKVAGRMRAVKLYDEQKVVKKQLDIYTKLLKGKGI